MCRCLASKDDAPFCIFHGDQDPLTPASQGELLNKVLRETYGHSLREWWYLAFLMPAYRFFTYWFRVAGMIYALTETAEWSAMNEWERIRQTAAAMLGRVAELGRLAAGRFKRGKEG